MGVLRPVNKTVAGFSCFRIVNSPHQRFGREGRLSTEEVADSIVDTYFRGMLKTDAPAVGYLFLVVGRPQSMLTGLPGSFTEIFG
jgi:hypothetical protein